MRVDLLAPVCPSLPFTSLHRLADNRKSPAGAEAVAGAEDVVAGVNRRGRMTARIGESPSLHVARRRGLMAAAQVAELCATLPDATKLHADCDLLPLSLKQQAPCSIYGERHVVLI